MHRAADPVSPKPYRLVGMLLSSAEQRRGDAERDQEAMRQALSGTSLDLARLPMPRLPMVPVFADEEGRAHILQSSPSGPIAVPFDVGEPLDPTRGDAGRGGLMSLESLRPIVGNRPAR